MVGVLEIVGGVGVGFTMCGQNTVPHFRETATDTTTTGCHSDRGIVIRVRALPWI